MCLSFGIDSIPVTDLKTHPHEKSKRREFRVCVCLSERIGSLRVVCVPCFQICECKSVTGVLRWCVRGGEGAYFASWFGRGLVLRERSTSSPNVFDSSHAELCPCAPTQPSVDFGAAKLATGHGHGERIYPKVSSFFRPVQFFFEGASFRLCCRTVLPVVQSVAHRPPRSHSCFCSST